MKIETIVNGKFGTNTYVVIDEATQEAIVIDPAEDAGRVIALLEEEKLALVSIINTHGHPDHIAGNKAIFDRYKVPIGISSLDESRLYDVEDQLAQYLGMSANQPKAEILLSDGDTLQVGSLIFEIIATPGHTEGGVSIYCPLEEVLFSGDTLFYRSMGRVDLPGGDLDAIKKSLAKLCTLPLATRVYPGHGQSTTIEFEKENNRYCLGGN